MKDKTLYWILGIGMVYFVVRFVMNHSSSKKESKKENVTKKTVDYPMGLEIPCRYCGADMEFATKDSKLTVVCTNPDCPSKQ